MDLRTMRDRAAALWLQHRRRGSNPYSAAAAAAALPLTAIGINRNDDLTFTSTISQWRAAFGGMAANVVLDAPAGTNEPVYSATGGPGGRPMAVFDNVNDTLRDAAVGLWGFAPLSFHLHAVGFVAGAETAGDVLFRYTGTDVISLNVSAVPQARGTTAGIGGTNTVGATTVTGTYRIMEFAGFGGASGTQSVLINNASDGGPTAITHGAWTDGGSLSLGASVAGATPTALSCIGWAITLGSTAAPALDATQRAYLRSFFQFWTGVA